MGNNKINSTSLNSIKDNNKFDINAVELLYSLPLNSFTLINDENNQIYLAKVKKLIFLGSSCIYPRLSKQPMKEEYLLSGKLEPTNEPYAIAKIHGLKMCENYNRQYKTNYISLHLQS